MRDIEKEQEFKKIYSTIQNDIDSIPGIRAIEDLIGNVVLGIFGKFIALVVLSILIYNHVSTMYYYLWIIIPIIILVVLSYAIHIRKDIVEIIRLSIMYNYSYQKMLKDQIKKQ